MSATTTAVVAKVGPIEFEATIHGDTTRDVVGMIQDIERRHPYVKVILPLRTFELVTGTTYMVRIAMDEDADYQQLCTLRAELKA